MKNEDIRIGSVYRARIEGVDTIVRVLNRYVRGGFLVQEVNSGAMLGKVLTKQFRRVERDKEAHDAAEWGWEDR